MTTAPASRPFTSGSFIFADIGVASALEASGAADVVRRQLAGFTQATRNEAVKEVERITAEVTDLNLGGCKQLSDDGILHLARMPQLVELDLSDHPGGVITDRGLEVLRHLPQLRRFQLCWQSGGLTTLGFGNNWSRRAPVVDL